MAERYPADQHGGCSTTRDYGSLVRVTFRAPQSGVDLLYSSRLSIGPDFPTFFIWETCSADRDTKELRVQRREPALRSSRAERVAADLEHEILSGRLPIGAHLGRRSEIMDRFGISPTVMNETLRILRDRDLVSVRPGPGGGIAVASAPPQVRLGALDLSFQPSNPHPLDLFEARLYLEFGLTKAAFERATSDDVAAMRSAMVAMRATTEAEQYFDAVLAFHRVVAAAAHIPVLEGMHQLIVTSIKAVLTRVVFVGDHEPLLASSLDVHDDIVAAIALHDQPSFVDAINRHDQDLIRGDDLDRTPNTPQRP